MIPTRAQTRANYDRLSRWYDLLSGGAERALREAGIRELAVRPGERVLEIGAGTGAALVELARAAGPEGLAVGVDLSMGMCGIAGLRIADLGSRNGEPLNAMIARGDAAHLPTEQGAFDAVFMSFALELFDEGEMRSVLAECGRALRPGGRLCAVAMAEPIRPTPMTRLYAWAHERYPATVDCRPIAAAVLLEASGYRVDRAIRRSLWGLPVEITVGGTRG
jgi:ubiquinone/menaquinone biosynthesis C-methylase UbiE